MSNNKFYFQFIKRTPKIYDFFPLRSKKKLKWLLISKVYHFYLFKKINIYIFLNYNKCKLLTFTQKNKRAFEYAQCACLEASINIRY